jgi:hypothetical protein
VLREALPRGTRPLAVGKSLADFRASLSEEALASVDALLVCGVVRGAPARARHACAARCACERCTRVAPTRRRRR